MRAADVAEALRDLHPDAASKVMAALPFDLAVQVFDEPELEGHRCRIIEQMGEKVAAPLIDAMSADQQADLFRELPERERPRFLKVLDAPTRETLSVLLRYRPDTAGGIMTTEFVAVPTNWSVGQTLDHISRVGRAKETVYTVYGVEPESKRLVHVVSLRDLMMADHARPIVEVGNRRRPLSVAPATDREEVARTISKYNLLALPVLDEGGHMLGIVTVDDVIDAIVREGTEDAQKFGGMEALDEPYMDISFPKMMKKRAGWLCALFIGEMLTATAMQHFEHELERAIVLTLFIPLIMSSGGNSGSQATSLIIRALALGQVKLRDWWRVALREMPSGLTLGALLGMLGILRIAVWQVLGLYDYGEHWRLVALTVGAGLLGIVTFGSMAGSMLPFILQRLGFDPASASAPFVATLVDVTGLVIYFSVAIFILSGTLL
jgi:magnesium transporter